MANTNCPKCGYAISEFDLECPRCKKMAEQAKTQPSPTPAAPTPPVSPMNTIGAKWNAPAPPPQVDPVVTTNWLHVIGLAILSIAAYAATFILTGVIGCYVMVLCTSVWMSIDASNVARGRAKQIGGMGPLSWFLCGILLWAVSFPYYIAVRIAYADAYGVRKPMWGLAVAMVMPMATVLFLLLSHGVLQNASVKAQQSSCLSNVKQIQLAMLSYAQDYDERFTPKFSVDGDIIWADNLSPYLKNSQVLYCPSRDQDVGYGYNNNLSCWSLGDIKVPAKTGTTYEWFTSSDLTQAGIDTSSGVRFGDKPLYPHNGGGNIGFCDGHAKWMTEPQVKDTVW